MFINSSILSDGAETGELLMGDRIEPSLYKLKMQGPSGGQDLPQCRVLACSPKVQAELSPEEVAMFHEFIGNEYMVQWLLDDLPAATVIPMQRATESDGVEAAEEKEDKSVQELFIQGFRLGCQGKLCGGATGSKDTDLFLNNHVRITVLINPDAQSARGGGVHGKDAQNVVGFRVKPVRVLLLLLCLSCVCVAAIADPVDAVFGGLEGQGRGARGLPADWREARAEAGPEQEGHDARRVVVRG